jgi:hypothetical protein
MSMDILVMTHCFGWYGLEPAKKAYHQHECAEVFVSRIVNWNQVLFWA